MNLENNSELTYLYWLQFKINASQLDDWSRNDIQNQGVDITSCTVFIGAFNCESLKGNDILKAYITGWTGTEPPMPPLRLWN